MFDKTTHYRIEVQGRVDLAWLQSFDSSLAIAGEAAGQEDDITVLDVRTDQAGIVGLVRRLHGLGITICRFQMTSEDGA